MARRKWPFRDPSVLNTDTDFDAIQVKRMHKVDDAESLQLVSDNTRARARQQRENLGVTDNTHLLAEEQIIPGKHASPPARTAISATPKQVTSVSAPLFTAGAHVPLDYPLHLLPEIVFLRALVYHNLAFSAPKAWFPGVPLNEDGGVTLHPVQAHKVSKKQAGALAMLWVRLDKDSYNSPHSTVVQHNGKFQLEARGATATGLQRSVKKALNVWKPGANTLRDLGVQDRTADAAAMARLTATMLTQLEAAGLGGTASFTADTAMEEADDESSNHSLQCDEFEPDPKHRKAMLRTAQREHWIRSEHKEMHDLNKRGAFTRVLRSSLPAGTRVFGSRFHYKIKRKHDMTVDKYKVRLVLQGQHIIGDKA